MTPESLLEAFETLADAPNSIAKLRELVLRLAVRGRLVPQNSRDEPVDRLIERIADEKARLVSEKQIRKPKPLPPMKQEEVPFDAPDGWKWLRLGDAALVVMGNSPPGDSYNETGDGVPLVNGPVEFSRGPLGATQETKFTTAPKQMCVKGDLLTCVRGATTGRTNIAAFDACIGRGVALVRAWSAQSYTNMFMWHVGEELLAAGKGTTFPSISYIDLAGKPFPMPPLTEQHRIVARVDELMALLDRLEAAKEARDATRAQLRDAALAALQDANDAEEVKTAWSRIADHMHDLFTDPADIPPLRQSVFRLALRGRLVPQDPMSEPASMLLERSAKEKDLLVTEKVIPKPKPLALLDASDLPFGLPDGWEAVRLGELLRATGAGWSPKCSPHPTDSDDEWGVLKTTAIQTNDFQERHHKALPSKLEARPEIEVHAGDVLVTRAGPWFRVGVAACVSRCRPRLMLSDKIIRCDLVSSDISGHWVAMAINTGPGADYLHSKQTGMDQAQVNISQSKLRAAPILVPPSEEQQRIVAKVDELMTMLDRLENSLCLGQATQESFAASAVQVLPGAGSETVEEGALAVGQTR